MIQTILLCILGLPNAKRGALINLLIVIVMLLGREYGLTILSFS